MLVYILGFLLLGTASTQETPGSVVVQPRRDVKNGLADTDLVLAFSIFRHGDRTSDEDELDLYPATVSDTDLRSIFFPYGPKALTNKGKQRAFSVGKYLRKRYDSFVSQLYLPEELNVRTTDYARTQMTALTALAGMYPPPSAQKWNPALDWQPIPYNTPDPKEDDLLYWYNCPRYLYLKNKVYEDPEIIKWLKPYEALFEYLQQKTGRNITTAEDVFYLDNLFQTLNNVGVKPPEWAQEVMPQIKELTKIEYAVEFYNSELIRLAAGVMMEDILNATDAAISGLTEQPKLRLYSAHENNVAALMAAARVFEPHQPNYGANFILELRKKRQTGEHGIVAVYAPIAGKPGKVLLVGGCGDQVFCNYETFKSLVQDVIWSKEDYMEQCPKTQ